MSEGSLRGSVVALLTPFLAVVASAVAAWVAERVPGVTLDPAQITTLMVAVVGAVITTAWNWQKGWRAHEERVSSGQAQPVRALVRH
jgi:hypothetical protein